MELKNREEKNDWSSIDNSLNYSYNPSLSYMDWDKAAVFVNGSLVWGKTPGASVSSTSNPMSSSSSSQAPLSSSSSSSSSSFSKSSSSSVTPLSSSSSSAVSSSSSANSSSSASVNSSIQNGAIKVQFYNGNASAVIANQIYPRFTLVNTGTTPITLASVKIRYYYTEEGAQVQSFWCDWSPVGSANVIGSFIKTAVKPLADTYLEVSFSPSAGSLAAGQSLEMQGRVAKSDWSNYDQSNDYSFVPNVSSYQDSLKTPVYLDGNLVWGVEP